MQRKTDTFQKYLWKRQKSFPMLSPAPSLVQVHICLGFTENQTDKGFEGSTPMPEKITCWLLQGEGMCSPDTSPSCLSPFYLPVCPLISLLSLPSAAKKHLANEGLNCTSAKHFSFGKLAFCEGSGYPHSPRFNTLARAGRMLEVEGCGKPGQGTLWSGFLLIFSGLPHPCKHASEGRS